MSSALPAMMPWDFVHQLPEVRDLTDDDECPVCLQKYVPTNAPAPGIIQRLLSMGAGREPEEHAVRLPCQHVMGSRCIRRWVFPNEGDKSTCPYCVQQMFTPLRYPVSKHRSWDRLMDILGDYGFTLGTDGTWLWDQTRGAAALSEKDIADARAIAEKHSAMLKKYPPPDDDTMATIQKIAASRSTAHLRMAVCYLQLQSIQVSLPAIEDVEMEYPFVKLGQHQKAALFDALWRDHGTRLDGEAWEFLRDLGIVPGIRWENFGNIAGNYPYFGSAL